MSALTRCLVALLAMQCLSAAATEMTLCADQLGMAPYYELKDNKVVGQLVDRAQAAAAELGISLSIEAAPFKRCLLKTIEGEYDGILAAVYLPERAKQLAFPSAAGTGSLAGATNFAEVSMFVHKDSNISWDGEQFHNLSGAVSTPPGWWTNDFFEKRELRLPSGVSPTKGIELVALNRLSGYVIYSFYGWNEAQQLGVEKDLRAIPIPELSHPWYIPFHKAFYQANKPSIEAFWQRCAKTEEPTL
ncbi:substrate-binding periplasmic protein [Aestuariibacter salexigens]|uniref:substrate-binding periplasmic protein n=1 Tax=Aestuariibacter salexigens TaxID=226010 RepID=UPI000404B058|nr:transporter substrate-binding domain-containing protein [Aestuariibacter salexigens]